MKVSCVKIVNPTNGAQVLESAWVRIGQEYVVISLRAEPGGSPALQILDDDGTPSWWAAEMFVTVSPTIPSSWIVSVRDGVVRLGPARLVEPGFWESYFDRDPAAVAVYEEERDQIIREAD